MAEVVVIGHAPSRAMYEKVGASMPSSAPAGLIVHTASEDADGTVRTVSVFESREASDAFEQDLLLPAIEKAMADSPSGAAPPDGPPVEYLEPFHVIRG
jgi:hypothetical protein